MEAVVVLIPSMHLKHLERQKHTKTMPAVAKEAVFTLERRFSDVQVTAVNKLLSMPLMNLALCYTDRR